jgi:TonB family protein
MRRFLVALTVCTFIRFASGSNAQSVPLAEVAARAVDQSKLTQTGSAPFHLKAKIVETTNPSSDYKAEIEEYWVSSEKLRRTISSPGFSQTLIVNGDKISDDSKGGYLPWWLNNLMTAVVDPLPLEGLKNTNAVMPKPNGSGHSNSCARMQMRVGLPPAENSAYAVYCFEGSRGLLEYAATPGYDAEFKDYRDFGNKRIARRIVLSPEPGTTIEAEVIELNELRSIDESLFAVQQETAPAERMARMAVPEATARTLFMDTPDIVWPSVRSGKTSGVLSIYISVDRSGHVREAWPLNSDNAGLDDAAREQVMKWTFKPAKVKDVPVQIETVLTFAFSSKVGNPVTILSDAEARKLATKIVEPKFPPGTEKGTEIKVQIGVGLDGSVSGVGNPYDVPTPLFMAAYSAVRQWHFRPYVRDGKPDLFDSDIVFRVP